MENRSLQLHFSANSLANKDVLSLSDPFLLFHTYQDGMPQQLVGRTEVVIDDLNPSWVATLSFSRIDEGSTFIVHAFDEDSTETDILHKHDFLGMATFSLNDVLNDRDMTLMVSLLPSEAYLYHNRILCSDEQSKQICNTQDESTRYAHHDSVDSWNTDLLSANSTLTSSDMRNSILEKENKSTAHEFTNSSDGNKFSLSDANQLRRATCSTRAISGLQGTLTIRGELLCKDVGKSILFDVQSVIVKECVSGVTSISPLRQFMEIQRRSACGKTWDVVYRSEDGCIISRRKKIMFKRAKISEQQLHNGSSDRTLRFISYRRRLRDKHDIIAWFETSLIDMTERGEMSKRVVPLETSFNDFDANGAGSACIRMENTKVMQNVMSIAIEFNHFIGPKYKAIIPNSSLCGLSTDWNVGETSNDQFGDGNQNGVRLQRRKTICQIPGFITRH